MGTLLSYAIASSLILIALYLPYKWLLSGIKRPGLNRLTILVIYAVAMTSWPLSNYLHSALTDKVAKVTIQFDNDIISAIATTTEQPGITVAQWMLIVYLAGLSVMTIRWIIAAVNIHRIVSTCETAIVNGHSVMVSDRKGIAPFSIFGQIVISRKDLDDAPLIVSHELVHVGRRHSIDLVVAQLVTIIQWFNPASWLMLRELRAVHEFEADNGVISSGANIKEYQLLLIKKAVGDRLPSPANSLNHSNLKTRITMMYDSRKMGNRRWRYFALVPAVAVALSVTNLNSVAMTLQEVSSSALPRIFNGEVMEISAVEQTVDKITTQPQESILETESAIEATNDAVAIAESETQLPAESAKKESDKIPDEPAEYPGGMNQLMRDLSLNIKYPEEALRQNMQGKVTLRFVVDTNGKISNISVLKSQGELLDNAAIKALKGVKDFKPASINGKPVSVYYVIPVEFKTMSDEPKTESKKTITLSGETPSFSTDQFQMAVEVDGEIKDYSELSKIKPDDIKSMTVKKSDPKYPNGVVVIVLNK